MCKRAVEIWDDYDDYWNDDDDDDDDDDDRFFEWYDGYKNARPKKHKLKES